MKILILIGLFILGCGDSSTAGFQELESPNVSVTLSVVDESGNPVTGANIKMMYDLDMTPGQYRPSTWFEVGVPANTNTNVSIYDLSGNIVSTLNDEVLVPGTYPFEISLDSALIALYAPLGMQVFRYSVDTATAGFLSKYMTLVYGMDTAQIPSIGITNDLGVLAFNKSEWFPHLYNLPEMQFIDESNNAQGTFYVTDFIENSTIIITVEHENRTKSYNTNIVAGNNNIELIWDLNDERSMAINNYESDMGLLSPYIRDITPGSTPTDLSLSQNSPNPFN